MRLRTLSLLLFVSLAVACASVGGDVDGSQADGSEFTCPRGLTRPFSVKTLIRVGQQNGVSLRHDPSCGAIPDAVEAASNIVIDDHVQNDDAVEAREGDVGCHLEDLPFAKPPFGVRRTKYPTDQETYLDVANVTCVIYPSQ
jgi:hypothetical protein